MMIRTVLCGLSLVAVVGAPANPSPAGLKALVGAYDVSDAAGDPAGALVLRDSPTTQGGYELVLSLGNPQPTYRTVYELKATEHPEQFRVIRNDSDQLLEEEATALVADESLIIRSWLVTRTGERVEVRDILGPANGSDLVVRTMAWPPSTGAPMTLRVLKATRVQ